MITTGSDEETSVKNGNEPSMFVQRPSSGRCQDISHVLTRIFRDVYTNDAVQQDTVKNLTTSKSGKSGYHDKYVESLQQIQQQWEEKMKIAKEIEQHLVDAHVQARKSELVDEQSSVDSISNYNDLGLPSVASQLSVYLDADTLRSNNLIVPQDFITEEKQIVDSENGERTPQHARPTTSSMQRNRKVPQEDNYYPEKSNKLDKVNADNQTSNNVDILKIDHSKKDTFQGDVTKPTKKKEKATITEEKQIWRDAMKPAQRMIERKDLEKLQKKADYLKNPRFVPLKTSNDDKSLKQDEQTDQTNNSLQKVNPRKIFQPYPDPVVFTDYKAGEVYEITFILKNMTSSSRQVRVLPPLTPFFSVGLGKFPTTDGLIAPGMSCQYSVKFAPDSLADYDDVLKVETTFAEPLFIPLQARRPPPNLNLSESFNCGHCLVNGTKTIQFNCTNNGGEGRFCVLPRNKWPVTNWEFTMENPGHVNLGPFVLKPAMFHLKTNESINIEVTFSPTSVKICKEEIVVICDNCNVKNFYIEGVGETAGVEFVSVEDGLNDYHLGEMKDCSAELLVRFQNQYPGTSKQKKLVIKNTTAVELEYHWNMDRPVFNNAANDGIKYENTTSSNQMSSAFEIVPRTGKLTPSDSNSFQMIFKPTKISEYHNVSRLILKNVPNFNQNDTEYSDVISTQIELKGYTKFFDVETEPKVIFIDGASLIDTAYEQKIMIHNRSSEEVTFDWPEYDDDACSINILPNKAVIKAEDTYECYVTLTGKKPGRISKTCICNIANVSSPVFFQIEAKFVGPTVRFSEAILNFGLVRHLQNQMRQIELKNYSNIPASWNFKENLTNFHRSISLSPLFGVIEPNSSETITVYLNADLPCNLETILEFEVKNGENRYLETRAVIQRPEVCILSSRLQIEECFVNVPVTKTIYLQNMTLFSVGYSWNQIMGNDKEHTSIIFEPESGILKPREKLEIEITFTFSQEMEITDLFAVCEVEGMESPLFLSINADVSGLKIGYSTPDVTGDHSSVDDLNKELKLEFGYDVAMQLNPKAVLLIKNQSAIVAPFSVDIEYFHSARIPTPPGHNKPKNNDSKRGIRPLLGKTPNIADHLSKTPEKAFKDHCNAVLSDGKGVAFIASPAQGTLDAFEQILIEITAYCNMWGEYTDNLVCKVGNLDPVKIPIHLETTGCPLNFQISKEPSPILRFGSHISGGEICSRSLKINNTGPCDVRLDWQSYVMDPDDNQILDLLVMIGDPFPQLDENEDEIKDVDRITEPLIQVKLNPHQGNRVEMPFQMKPKQMIVPAKSHSYATANFIPTGNQKNKIDLQGYALGFMSLSKQDAMSNHTLRCDGIDVTPFHLNFTAEVKPAKLFIEPESEDGFHFVMAASELLLAKDESTYTVGEEAVCSRRFVISNLSGTSLQFSMAVEEPFNITNDKISTVARNEKHFNLKQDNNLEVKVGLNLTQSLLEWDLGIIKDTSKISDGKMFEVNEEKKELSEIHLKRQLRLQFSNNTSQFYDLSGTIQLPVLELSQHNLDFETCLVGQTREAYVTLRNTGKSKCYWTAEIDKDNPEASKSVFSLKPQNGLLQADVDYNEKNTETVKVNLTARHNVGYECRVIFKDVLGNRCLILTLCGRGSYDQISEKLVNVLT